MRFLLSTLFIILTSTIVHAEIHYIRWDKNKIVADNLEAILPDLKLQTGINLTFENYTLVEDKELANSRFQTYSQLNNGISVKGALIRIWSVSNKIIQMEAHIDDLFSTPKSLNARDQFASRMLNKNITFKSLNLNSKQKDLFFSQIIKKNLDNYTFINKIVRNHPDDRRIKSIKSFDQWNGSDLERVIQVTAQHGVHTIVVSHISKKIKEFNYAEFPQTDVAALVYPIYEESEKNKALQNRIPVILKDILPNRRLTSSDPYAPLRANRYFEDMMDPVQGETEAGRSLGFWSPNWIMMQAKNLFEALPQVPNSFEAGGLYLEGKYATINIHPEAMRSLKGINFSPIYSPRLAMMWKPSAENESRWEVIPTGAYYGMPLTTPASAINRLARRLPDNDVVTYINDGFDEVQVYYAITRLMESLHDMGFTDTELSTRPFHAFLYDPDISMKDNAYYTNDTINFTTYSPDAQNFARDNSTIWHELGHGVMDRLMGDLIKLADSGGLAEGMADFVAQLVIQDVTSGSSFDGSEDFRIINKTGFNLTNESHDDGEAYGGTMNDILLSAIHTWGRAGLHMMTDLTLEAMRLTRNHPALTANDWFEHMLYADELGKPGVREPGAMKNHIINALQSRNFNLDRSPVAEFNVKFGDDTTLTNVSPGSRGNPLTHILKEGEEVSYNLKLSLKSSESIKFKYPVKIEIVLNGGPLEGAVKWKGEQYGPFVTTLMRPEDTAQFSLTALPGCDFVNREDGSCSDYAYLKVYNAGESQVTAKKRFYLRIKSQ